MSDLLEQAIDAHGGARRWDQVSPVRVAAAITGAVWARAGHPGLPGAVVVQGEARDQRVIISPFPRPGHYATFAPGRQTIETAGGLVVAERHPAAALAGLSRASPWDELQVACFAAQASWNYLVAPFLLARSDFVTREAGPWTEDGQTWHRLLVTYPDAIVAHARQQTCYFDGAGLLRRLDYSADIPGGGPAVQYPSEYREFDGIMVATRRRDYARNSDGSPVRDSAWVAIDVTNAAFT